MKSLAEELVEISEQGSAAVLATVVEVAGGIQVEPGAKCLVRNGKVHDENLGDARVVQAILEESANRLREEKSKLVSLDVPDDRRQVGNFFRSDASAAETDRGRRRAISPCRWPEIAKVLDFHVTVIDDRLLYANRERFPDADEVVVGDMAQMLKEMTITPSCYIVLITRGHAYDEPCLRVVLPEPGQIHWHDRQPAAHQSLLPDDFATKTRFPRN